MRFAPQDDLIHELRGERLRNRLRDLRSASRAPFDPLLGRSRGTAGHARTPHLNSAANDRVAGGVEQFIQSSAVDLIETNEHDWIVLVMRLQIKDARVVGYEFLSTLESNRYRDRVRIGAAMASLNDKYFTVDFQRGQIVISGFFYARERQSQLANNIERSRV